MAQKLFTNKLFDDVDDFVAQYREACKTTNEEIGRASCRERV